MPVESKLVEFVVPVVFVNGAEGEIVVRQYNSQAAIISAMNRFDVALVGRPRFKKEEVKPEEVKIEFLLKLKRNRHGYSKIKLIRMLHDALDVSYPEARRIVEGMEEGQEVPFTANTSQFGRFMAFRQSYKGHSFVSYLEWPGGLLEHDLA